MSQDLSLLEDPTASHVMPTSLVQTEREPTRNMLMLPPSGLPSKRKRKEVLEEEEYVEALSHIIERDYFPRLAASKASEPGDARLDGQSVDAFFQKFTSYDNDSFEELQMKSVEDHKRQYPWLYELPDDGGPHRRSGMMMLYYLGDKILTQEQRDKMERIMDGPANVGDHRPNGSQPGRFRVRNQLMFPPELAVSEDICRMRDHEAVDLLQDASHQQKKSILPGQQDLQAALLLTNTHASTHTNMLTNTTSTENSVKSATNSATNSVTESLSGVLNNHSNNFAALQQALVRYNKRYSSATIRSEKTIQRNNTSLPATNSTHTTPTLTSEQLLSWDRSYRARQQGLGLGLGLGVRGGTITAGGRFVLEEPHTPSLRSTNGSSADTASECSDFHFNKMKEYKTVPMSPCPDPGNGALQSLTPLFTWGSVENTPILLHQATPLAHSTSTSKTGIVEQIQQHTQQYLLQRLAEDEDLRMKALQTQAYEEESRGLPRFELTAASRRERLARTLDAGRQSLTSSGSGKSGSVGSSGSNRGSSVRGGSVGSTHHSIERSGGSASRNDKRRRSVEDVSDEVSVDARRNYYRSANQHAHTNPSPSVTSTSTRANPNRNPSNPSSSSSSALSAAQRLARLTPAARALALKLHKNLSAPPTPLG